MLGSDTLKVEEGTERGKARLGLDIPHLAVTKSGLGEAASRDRRQAGSNFRCLVPGRRFEERGPALGIADFTCIVIEEVWRGTE